MSERNQKEVKFNPKEFGLTNELKLSSNSIAFIQDDLSIKDVKGIKVKFTNPESKSSKLIIEIPIQSFEESPYEPTDDNYIVRTGITLLGKQPNLANARLYETPKGIFVGLNIPLNVIKRDHPDVKRPDKEVVIEK